MKNTKALLALILLLLCNSAFPQSLEPRRWSHLPSDVNFFGLGGALIDGEILFDPALLVEDATMDLTGLGAVYIRSFNFYGKSARIDFTAPFTNGKWEGLVDGVQTIVKRRGFGDPRVRLSVNLYGAPALKGKEFRAYRLSRPVNTTIGAAVSVKVPLGEYSSDRLINLGQNRWIMRPQLGVLHQRGKWEFELTGSVIFYGKNDEFWKGTVRQQDPLWFLQTHIIRTFKPGLWAGFSTGFGHGGRSRINDSPKSDDSRVGYWALTLGVPITPYQGLKFTYFSARTNTSNDVNLNSYQVGWSIMFGQ
jgi:hypothetical protein